MKKVAIVPLAMGVVIGGLAIKLGLDTIREAKAGTQQQIVAAVISTADISPTAKIEPHMVTTVETPHTPLLGNDGFTSPEDVIGRVAASPIPRGAAVRESLLAPPGTPPGLGVRIEQGFRAVSVSIDEVTGVAYQLQPGAFVDVIVVMDVRNAGRMSETISRVILQNAEVAAVGRALQSESSPDGKGRAAKSVTLLVPEGDVPRLHLAQTRGKLTLALRATEDDELTDQNELAQARESELFGGAKAEEAEDEKVASRPQVIPNLSFRPQPQPSRVVTLVNGADQAVEVSFTGDKREMRRVDRPWTRSSRNARRGAGSQRGGNLPGAMMPPAAAIPVQAVDDDEPPPPKPG